jgi:type III pantothenate kinase
MASRYLGHEMLAVGPGTKTGMAIRYDNPREIGADRLVNAVAIRERFGGACVCVDFGTATTFDIVSGEGEYMGGALMTGIEISLEALSERGARLPKVDLAPPRSVIGKNTIDAIRSGVVFGYAGAIDAILRRLYVELGARPDVVATGGLAGLVVPFCEEITEVDEELTLTGLRLLHARNAQPRDA